jgi:antitoxin (DNA-binding transcriptional repressor) of toxin-antitoxin stability system
VITLTITGAKKNLGKWLSAALNGQEVGIVSGAAVVALRPVQIQATDYAWREYGLATADLDAFIAVDNKRLATLRRAGRLIRLPTNPKKTLEKNTPHRSRRAKAASRASAKRARRRRA